MTSPEPDAAAEVRRLRAEADRIDRETDGGDLAHIMRMAGRAAEFRAEADRLAATLTTGGDDVG